MHCCIVWLIVLACLFPSGRAEAEETTSLDFIYVNANIGEAAGGHAALRLGSTMFHFQFFPEGRFLLVRDSWSHFHYVYNELRNRSVFIARLPLSAQVYASLRAHFTRLLMAQQQDLEVLDSAERELLLLSRLADGTGQLALDTLGLFDCNGTGNADMLTLQQEISLQLGESFVTTRQVQLERRLRHLNVDLVRQLQGTCLLAEIQELLLEQEFFRVLARGAPLAPVVVISPSPDFAALSPAEEQILQKYRTRLLGSIIRLLQSRRKDRPQALLLQTARYLVVCRSLASHTLLTLDPFSARAVAVQPPADNDLQGLFARIRRDAARSRQDFFREIDHPDIAYAILETARGRLYEIEKARDGGSPIRVELGILLPSRQGKVSLAGLSMDHLTLEARTAAKRVEVAAVRQRLDSRYEYDLLERNCATELLRALNSAFPDRETGRRELGGWLEPDKGLNFIPNQFYTAVLEEFPVCEERALPSRRLRQLAALYAENNVLSVLRVRESNTVSSTLYRARIEDTPFLFFTDNTFLLRPVQGIANFCWAAVSGLSGILTLPLDGGERIYQGARGMFYSLPELVFNNIRKGTYGFAATAAVGP